MDEEVKNSRELEQLLNRFTVIGGGGTVLVAGAVVAYIKRDAIREAKNDIIADVKRLLKKEKPEIAE